MLETRYKDSMTKRDPYAGISQIINTERIAAIALSSVLTCAREGFSPLSIDTVNEARLAHSLLTKGEPSVEELRPFLGEHWAVTRRRVPNRISAKQYFIAKVKALAKRLGVSEGFILTRIEITQRKDFDQRVAVPERFSIVVTSSMPEPAELDEGAFETVAAARDYVRSRTWRPFDKIEVINNISGEIVYRAIHSLGVGLVETLSPPFFNNQGEAA